MVMRPRLLRCIMVWISIKISSPSRLCAWVGNHLSAVKSGLFLLSLVPAIELYLLLSDQIEVVNLFAAVMRTSGVWALNFLALTLFVTPLRRFLTELCILSNAVYGKRLGDWNWLIKCRRMLGLFSFFYASLQSLMRNPVRYFANAQ